MAKILIDSRDDIITYWDRKCEITFLVADPVVGALEYGKCKGCDASHYMKCDEVRCTPGERKDRKHKIFVFLKSVPKPREISFFENLKEDIRERNEEWKRALNKENDDWLFRESDDFLTPSPMKSVPDNGEFLW